MPRGVAKKKIRSVIINLTLQIYLSGNKDDQNRYDSCSDYHTSALISHASKVMLKILQARLQQYVNRELPDVQAGLRKGRGTRDQIANIRWIIEKAREFQKNNYFCFFGASLVAQRLQRLPGMWETWVQSLGGEDFLGKGMATHSSTLA